jgi:hypothetical protein
MRRRGVSAVALATAIWSGAASADDRTVTVEDFEGRYAAIGGGYGVGQERHATVFGFSSAALFDTGRIDGAFFLASIGVDRTVGTFLVGADLTGRVKGESFDQVKTPPIFFPQASRDGYAFQSDAGIHIAGRLGTLVAGTLVYARAGGGVTLLKETFSYHDQPFFLAANTAVSLGPPPPLTGSTTVKNWRPSGLLGVGMERNFGSLFGRIGADFEVVDYPRTKPNTPFNGFSSYSTGDSPMWFGRVSAMVGYRF